MVAVQKYYMLTNIWFCLLVIGALISMTTYTWRFRRIPGGTPQICIQICKSIWLMVLILMMISAEASNRLFWNRALHIADMLCPYFWLMFVMEISHQQGKVPKSIRSGISKLVYCLAIGMLIYFLDALFWPDIRLKNNILQIIFVGSTHISVYISYLACVLALGFSIRWVWITTGLRRRQALWFTAAGVISAAGSIVSAFFPIYMNTVLPFGFLIGGMFVTWGFYRWHVYNVLPLSQKIVVQDMIDGLLVVDEYGYIADLNRAAQLILQDVPCHVGDRFEHITAAWPELTAACHTDVMQIVETTRNYSEGRRYYQIQTTPLKIRNKWLGMAIIFKNITIQKKRQEKLLEQQKALSILNERDRLSRELHDDRAQVYSFLGFELQAIHFLLCDGQGEKAIKEVEKLREIIKKRTLDTRESIMGLKKTSASGSGFITKIRKYLAWYEKNNGIAAKLILPAQPVSGLLNDTAELQVLRIIQEALTNVRKHAGAKQVKIRIERTEQELSIAIEDDGCGFDSDATYGKDKHFGLQIMAERAEEAGGKLFVHTKAGEGTTVMIHFYLSSARP